MASNVVWDGIPGHPGDPWIAQGSSAPTANANPFTGDTTAARAAIPKTFSGIGSDSWGAGIGNFINSQNAAAGTPSNVGGNAGNIANPSMPVLNSPFGANPTLGSLAGGMGKGGSSMPPFQEAAGNYTGGMQLGDYLNPAAGWARDEGLEAVKSGYAGAGDFLSGNAMKGISDYTSKSTLNSAWQPAFNNYMQDKGFNLGVDTGDRAFEYGANKDLANLGLAGTQGSAASNSQLATLLAQLAQSAGQAQGTGTMGQSNALTQAIANALANYQQGDVLNRVLPGG